MSSDLRHALGRQGEDLAVAHLERLGLVVLDRNYRTRFGELDVIADDGRALVFVEVKTRRAGSRVPFDSIGADKQSRVRARAVEWMRERLDRPYRPEIRFDAIGVTIDAHGRLVALEHLEAAF
jgi:putative endonuclease